MARRTAPGDLADDLAAADPRIRVLHRPAKQGLGRAYLDGFGVALAGGATVRRPDGCRLQPRPGGTPRRSSPRSPTASADLVIGSRYTTGGGVVDWGIGRRIISRGGSIFARIVLGLGPNDLTGGFKAWRADDAGRRPVRRHPCRRLRLPDRDDVPRESRAGPASARSRSPSGIAGSARARCRGGSSSRRWSSSSSSARRSSRARWLRRRPRS